MKRLTESKYDTNKAYIIVTAAHPTDKGHYTIYYLNKDRFNVKEIVCINGIVSITNYIRDKFNRIILKEVPDNKDGLTNYYEKTKYKYIENTDLITEEISENSVSKEFGILSHRKQIIYNNDYKMAMINNYITFINNPNKEFLSEEVKFKYNKSKTVVETKVEVYGQYSEFDFDHAITKYNDQEKIAEFVDNTGTHIIWEYGKDDIGEYGKATQTDPDSDSPMIHYNYFDNQDRCIGNIMITDTDKFSRFVKYGKNEQIISEIINNIPYIITSCKL